MSERGRILLVDDEPNIRLTFGTLLQRAGYTVMVAENGEQALGLLEQQRFDVLITDMHMPGMDGLQVAVAAHAHQPDIAILVLTGHGALETAIEALHLHVFDYLLKTTEPQDVLRRVDAAVAAHTNAVRQEALLTTLASAVDTLRVEEPESSPHPTTEHESRTIGAIHLDGWRQTVTIGERTTALTPTEFRVLRCLMEHAGMLMSYTRLVQCVQGYELGEQDASDLIKPHIHHLRQKIEPNPDDPQYILNVRGKGYLLVPTGG